jgi:hypothetical protein
MRPRYALPKATMRPPSLGGTGARNATTERQRSSDHAAPPEVYGGDHALRLGHATQCALGSTALRKRHRRSGEPRYASSRLGTPDPSVQIVCPGQSTALLTITVSVSCVCRRRPCGTVLRSRRATMRPATSTRGRGPSERGDHATLRRIAAVTMRPELRSCRTGGRCDQSSTATRMLRRDGRQHGRTPKAKQDQRKAAAQRQVDERPDHTNLRRRRRASDGAS